MFYCPSSFSTCLPIPQANKVWVLLVPYWMIAASFSALYVCSNMKHCMSYVCEFSASCATGYCFEVSRYCIALARVLGRDAQQMYIAGEVFLWVGCHISHWKVMEVHSFLLVFFCFFFFPPFFVSK